MGQIAIEARIPRLIHQTYPSGDLPSALARNSAYLRETNPSWEYRFYDDADVARFVSNVYGGRVLSRFLSLNPDYGAARADLFRYLLLYERGGVYLDIKSSVTCPIDHSLLESDQYILSQWNNRPGEEYEDYGWPSELRGHPGGEFQQWHIISVPKHPILKSVISAVLANIASYTPETHGVGWSGVMRTTGPVPYTIAVNRVRHAYRHRCATNAELGLRYTVLNGKKAHERVYRRAHYSHLSTPLVLASR